MGGRGRVERRATVSSFDDPDITIFTNDPDASWAVWEMANAAEERGEKSFELSEKLERSLSPDRIHELWIVANDGLRSGVLLLSLYGAFKALEPKEGRRIKIRFRGGIQISKDDQNRFRALGIEVTFEKTATGDDTPKLPPE
jgi:hypothetical protein